jgi:hypothetical protein
MIFGRVSVISEVHLGATGEMRPMPLAFGGPQEVWVDRPPPESRPRPRILTHGPI